MKLIFIILSILYGSGICYSQKEDYHWILGKHISNPIYWNYNGINILDFNNDPVKIKSIPDKKYSTLSTSTLFSDSEGELKFFSNGMHILDKDFRVISGGERINYNSYWNIFKDTYADGSERLLGLKLSQGMLMLPFPDRDSVIWLTYNSNKPTGSIYTSISEGIMKGLIDLKQNQVIEKDIVFFKDTINPGSMQSCRHANGRDWWIICSSRNHDRIYTFLLDNHGIRHLYTLHQPIDYIVGHGQARFSPDGTKYVSYEVVGGAAENYPGHLIIYDFDRCTGLLSNLRYEIFYSKSVIVGCAISENSRYLYAGKAEDLLKYDLQSEDIIASKEVVAQTDDFHSVLSELDSIPNDFGFLQLAPDGKIYGPGGNTLHMHRINYPDEEGSECGVEQHAIKTFYNLNTVPNHPYFRLGPKDGSDCDTLGLDNHPIAKFRYEQDTTNHLNVRFTDLSYFRPETWHWDFGDGSTFDGRKPYWHEFPKNGTYNVCLTVSNEISENTMCRTVTIGSNSVSDTIRNQRHTDLISLFPNPTEGEVLLTLSYYIPEHGVVYVYDMMGKEVFKQRVYYGWNNVDLSNLIAGNYIYVCKDNTSTGSVLVGEGKIVKL